MCVCVCVCVYIYVNKTETYGDKWQIWIHGSMEITLKVKHRTTLQSSNCSTRYLLKENKNTNSKEYIYSPQCL